MNRNARCAYCQEPIEWQRSKMGKPSPMDKDGSSHWTTCPKAAEVRAEYRRKREGDRQQEPTRRSKQKDPELQIAHERERVNAGQGAELRAAGRAAMGYASYNTPKAGEMRGERGGPERRAQLDLGLAAPEHLEHDGRRAKR